MNTFQKKTERLDHLRNMLGKYAHRWGEYPSARMQKWVDEYNDIKNSMDHIAWREFCEARGSSTGHDAYDLLA